MPLVGPGLSATASVRDLEVGPDGRLLMCGINLGSGSPVLEWTGASWSNLVNGPAELGNWASTIVPLSDGRVVVAGEITPVTRTAIRGIAAWDGETWQTLKFGVVGPPRCVVELPNGDIAVGGPTSVFDGGATLALWFFHFGDQHDPSIDAPFTNAALGVGIDHELAFPTSGAAPLTYRLQRQILTSSFGGTYTTWQSLNPGVISLQCSGTSPMATFSVDQFSTYVNLTINVSISARYRPATCRTLVLRGVVTNSCGEDVTPPISLTFCSSDFNGDRETNLSDLFDYLNVWFYQYGTVVPTSALALRNANFDPDPRVAASDLFAFLDQWTAPDPACVP